jgi:hypothetical protein
LPLLLLLPPPLILLLLLLSPCRQLADCCWHLGAGPGSTCGATLQRTQDTEVQVRGSVQEIGC